MTTGVEAVDTPVNDYLGDRYYEGVTVPAGAGVDFMETMGWVWLAGAAGIAVYGVVSYLRLRRRVRASLPLREGIYLCDDIATPFILGAARPRIYLPSGMDESVMACVLRHEEAHLRRRDHWWKVLGYGLLAVYWFHPLVWVGYALFCRDMEAACDEAVIRAMDSEGRTAYSRALLSCSAPGRRVAVCGTKTYGTDNVALRRYLETLRAVENLLEDSSGSADAVSGAQTPLDAAIAAAVIEKYAAAATPAAVWAESHRVLATEESGDTLTAYVLATVIGADNSGAELYRRGGDGALTFAVDNDTYTLLEYWTPGDGAAHDMDAWEKYPPEVAEIVTNGSDAGVMLCETLWSECLEKARNSLTGAAAQQIYTFGHYEQDGDTTNGPEPIEWLVLARRGTQWLLLSRKCLDVQCWQTPRGGVGYEATWETCSLRAWLGGDFLSAAFSAEEQAQLLPVQLENRDNTHFGHVTDASGKEIFVSEREAAAYYPDAPYTVSAVDGGSDTVGVFCGGHIACGLIACYTVIYRHII